MNKKLIGQQGDVLFFAIDGIPKEAKQLNHFTLAEGEATGHSHEVIGTDRDYAELSQITEQGSEGQLYLKAKKDITITHQEHGIVTIPKGTYQIGKVQEFDYDKHEARNVQD